MLATLLAVTNGIGFAASPSTTQPALASLDAEIQQLYRDAQESTVRVQVPIRISVDHPFIKWRMQLDPELRRQLEAPRNRGESLRMYVQAPASQPVQTTPEANRIPIPSPSAVITVEYVGLVLNAQGDVLLPLYIDKSYLDSPLQVSLNERLATTAKVVASDRQTSLSIVRLADATGTPCRFAASLPPTGALLLMMSPTRRAARLALWTGGQDDNAILINRNGEIAGIVRNGHPLFPSTFMPVVEQLLSSGTVRRAQLGVRIHEVPADDPRRVKIPALGARPAARVEEVLPDSAAATAGLQMDDMILSIGGEAVEDVATFAANIANRRGRTELLILRDGREQSIVVDLQAQ
jgi:membrane-associated protease RseP (regulator of RpoE activity)